MIKYMNSHPRSVIYHLCDQTNHFASVFSIQSMEFSRPESWNGEPFPSPGDLPNPGIKPRSPALQEDCLSVEPQGKLNNTGVGTLSLLQQIFLTQESNQGFLHQRQILDQLSHQGWLIYWTLEWVTITEYLSELPFPSPGDLPNPRIEPGSPALQKGSLLPEPPGKPSKGIYLSLSSKSIYLSRRKS